MLEIKRLCYQPYCTCSNKAFKKNILHAITWSASKVRATKGLKAS
jgi:hypothetical protein